MEKYIYLEKNKYFEKKLPKSFNNYVLIGCNLPSFVKFQYIF